MTWGSTTFPTTAVGTTSGTPLVVTLWNNGTAGVPLSSVTTSNADEFPFSTTCQLTGTLPPSSTCSVTARFRPGGTGARTGTLTISANSTSQVLSLTGTGALINPQVSISGAGDSAPTLFILSVTGATPSGQLALHTIYTPDPGNPTMAFDVVTWTADSSGNLTANVTTESPGLFEHWLVDLSSGLSTNHVFHRMP
jgi:hypothetical protein